MTKDWLRDAGFETLAIREGLSTGSEQEHSDPIYATSSFVFDSAEQRQRPSLVSERVIPIRAFQTLRSPSLRSGSLQWSLARRVWRPVRV